MLCRRVCLLRESLRWWVWRFNIVDMRCSSHRYAQLAGTYPGKRQFFFCVLISLFVCALLRDHLLLGGLLPTRLHSRLVRLNMSLCWGRQRPGRKNTLERTNTTSHKAGRQWNQRVNSASQLLARLTAPSLSCTVRAQLRRGVKSRSAELPCRSTA